MYTRLNGVILCSGILCFMIATISFLNHPNLRELPCKLRGSRQSIPFPRFQDTFITCFVFSFIFGGLLKLGQGQEKHAMVKPSRGQQNTGMANFSNNFAEKSSLVTLCQPCVLAQPLQSCTSFHQCPSCIIIWRLSYEAAAKQNQHFTMFSTTLLKASARSPLRQSLRSISTLQSNPHIVRQFLSQPSLSNTTLVHLPEPILSINIPYPHSLTDRTAF